MKTEDRIMINIIGTGYDLSIANLNYNTHKILSEIKKLENNKLHYLLFDDSFYIDNIINVNHKSWRDFNNVGQYRGADLFHKGQIEIWINRKRKKTYQFSEIENSTFLFPLFNCDKDFLFKKANQLIIGVKEQGYLNKFIFSTPKFSIEGLTFHITEIKFDLFELKILHNITYQGIQLTSIKSDTVVIGNVCEIVNL